MSSLWHCPKGSGSGPGVPPPLCSGKTRGVEQSLVFCPHHLKTQVGIACVCIFWPAYPLALLGCLGSQGALCSFA